MYENILVSGVLFDLDCRFSQGNYDFDYDNMTTLMENISFAWTGDLELLKQFVNEILNLDGEWSQPGSDRKVFTYGDSSITWRKNKCLLSFTGERSDEVKREVCKQICVNSLAKATQSVFDQSNKSQQACTEAIESLKADQKLNNGVIQSLAESISRISAVVCELQTRLENSDFNTPYLKSQSKESGNANQSSEDSCIVIIKINGQHNALSKAIKTRVKAIKTRVVLL